MIIRSSRILSFDDWILRGTPSIYILFEYSYISYTSMTGTWILSCSRFRDYHCSAGAGRLACRVGGGQLRS